MAHFVCVTCRVAGENPGFCQTPDCATYGQDLKECSCEDEAHKELLGEEEEVDDELGFEL